MEKVERKANFSGLSVGDDAVTVLFSDGSKRTVPVAKASVSAARDSLAEHIKTGVLTVSYVTPEEAKARMELTELPRKDILCVEWKRK